MLFPYDRYETLAAPLAGHYPAGEEALAIQISQTVNGAAQALAELLDQPVPALGILLVDADDWQLAPHDEEEEIPFLHPYWTDATSPPSIVVPTEIDPIFGDITQEKLAFMLYQAVTLAFLEADPRPWPEDYPLWADEWQVKFAALWLSHTLDDQTGVVNMDLVQEYAEIFEPEPDGKTPDTIRGFDWYEDTPPEAYLCYELLLEQLAADLLSSYDPGVLPRFLTSYRTGRDLLLSDDVTAMLAAALGPGGAAWLENLVYF
jgi:hypothetical protein